MSEQRRAETGTMQFPDDWPGVFMRGKHAFAFSMALKSVLETSTANPIFKMQVEGLISLLESSNIINKPTPQLAKLLDTSS